MSSPRALARIGGGLYLIVAIGGAFSQLYVRGTLWVPGNPAATAANIASHADLFRAGFVTDLVDFTAFLGVGIVMYALLKHVQPDVAVAMLVINAVSVAMQALNLLGHLGALIVATEPAYAGLGNATVLLLLDLQQHGYLICQVFFGLYLLPLGYLVYRSRMFPRFLGVILAFGAAGYVADVAAVFASPTLQSTLGTNFAMAGGLAELAFLLWLLVMGARQPSRASTPKEELAWSA
jgi:Domain of unknown function (DUF4386)